MKTPTRWLYPVAALALCLTLWLGGIAHASTPPGHGQQPQGQFQTLEQPLSIRIAVTVGTLGLAVLEFWWFLGKPAAPAIPPSRRPQ